MKITQMRDRSDTLRSELFQELVNQAYALALEVHYRDVLEEGEEQVLISLLRILRATLQIQPDFYGRYDDPQLLLGPEEEPVRKPDPPRLDHRGRPLTMRTEQPYSTTRGLSSIAFPPELARLRRLKREWDHCARRHAPTSRSMLDKQCERLHRRVYPGTSPYYGPLPSGPDYRSLLR